MNVVVLSHTVVDTVFSNSAVKWESCENCIASADLLSFCLIKIPGTFPIFR